MDDKEFIEQYLRYQKSPESFTSSEELNLQLEAARRGIDFRTRLPLVDYVPKPEEPFLQRVLHTAEQVPLGFIEGLTTIPIPAVEPKTTGEGIFRSLGSVLGFAFPGSAPQRVFKAVDKAISGAILHGVKEGLEGVAKMSTAKKMLVNMAKEGTAMAATSAVMSWPSVWTDGVKGLAEAAAWGGFYGAGFNALRLIPAFAGAGKARAFARVLASGMFMALPSHLRGQTTPEQVYHFLLGAYFGIPGRGPKETVKEYVDRDLISAVLREIDNTLSGDPDAWRKVLTYLGDYVVTPQNAENKPIYMRDGQYYVLDTFHPRKEQIVLRRLERQEKSGNLDKFTPTKDVLTLSPNVLEEGLRLFSPRSRMVELPDGKKLVVAHSFYGSGIDSFRLVDNIKKIPPVGTEAEEILKSALKRTTFKVNELRGLANRWIVRYGDDYYLPMTTRETGVLKLHKVYNAALPDVEWVVDTSPKNSIPATERYFPDSFEPVRAIQADVFEPLDPESLDALRRKITAEFTESLSPDIKEDMPEEFRVPELSDEPYTLRDLITTKKEVLDTVKNREASLEHSTGDAYYDSLLAFNALPYKVKETIYDQIAKSRDPVDFATRALKIVSSYKEMPREIAEAPEIFNRLWFNRQKVPINSKNIAEFIVPQVRDSKIMGRTMRLRDVDWLLDYVRTHNRDVEDRVFPSYLDTIKDVTFKRVRYAVYNGDLVDIANLKPDVWKSIVRYIEAKDGSVLIGVYPKSGRSEALFAKKLKPDIAKKEFAEMQEQYKQATGQDMPERLDPTEMGTLHKALKALYGDNYLATGRFIKFSDITKRLQLPIAKGFKIPDSVLKQIPDGNGIVTIDGKKYLRYKVRADEGTGTDGLTYTVRPVLDLYSDITGFSNKAGALKTAVIFRDKNGASVTMLKHSEQPPPPDLEKELISQGYAGIVHESVLKGNKGLNGEKMYKDGDDLLVPMDSVIVISQKHIPPEHNWKVVIPKQFSYLTSLTSDIMEKSAEKQYERIQILKREEAGVRNFLETVGSQIAAEHLERELAGGPEGAGEAVLTPGQLMTAMLDGSFGMLLENRAANYIEGVVRTRIQTGAFGDRVAGGIAVLGDYDTPFLKYMEKTLGKNYMRKAEKAGVPELTRVYLDYGWREMPLSDVFDQLVVAEWTKGKIKYKTLDKLVPEEYRKRTLGDAWDYLKNAEKRTQKFYTIKIVAGRTPISTSYDVQALDLIGFTGEEHPGYRAHITDTMMHIFGGADLDIDTAFLLPGVGKEVTLRTIERTGGLAEELSKLDSVLNRTVKASNETNWFDLDKRAEKSLGVAKTQNMIGFIMSHARNVRAFWQIKLGKGNKSIEKPLDLLTAVYQRAILDSGKYGVAIDLQTVSNGYALLAEAIAKDHKFAKRIATIMNRPNDVRDILSGKIKGKIFKDAMEITGIDDPKNAFKNYGDLFYALRDLHNVWLSRNYYAGRKYNLFEIATAIDRFSTALKEAGYTKEQLPGYLRVISNPKYAVTGLDTFDFVTPYKYRRMVETGAIFPEMQDVPKGTGMLASLDKLGLLNEAEIVKIAMEMSKQENIASVIRQITNAKRSGILARDIMEKPGGKLSQDWARTGYSMHRAVLRLLENRYPYRSLRDLMRDAVGEGWGEAFDYDNYVERYIQEHQGEKTKVPLEYLADRSYLTWFTRALEKVTTDPDISLPKRAKQKLAGDIVYTFYSNARNDLRATISDYLKGMAFWRLRNSSDFVGVDEKLAHEIIARSVLIKRFEHKLKLANRTRDEAAIKENLNKMRREEGKLWNLVKDDEKLRQFASAVMFSPVRPDFEKLPASLKQIMQPILRSWRRAEISDSTRWREDPWYDPAVFAKVLSGYRYYADLLMDPTWSQAEHLEAMRAVKDTLSDINAPLQDGYVFVINPEPGDLAGKWMEPGLRKEWRRFVAEIKEKGPYYLGYLDWAAKLYVGRPLTDLSTPELRFFMSKVRDEVSGKKMGPLNKYLLKHGMLWLFPEYVDKYVRGQIPVKQSSQVIARTMVSPYGGPVMRLQQFGANAAFAKDELIARHEKELTPLVDELTNPRYSDQNPFRPEDIEHLTKVASALYEAGFTLENKAGRWILSNPDLDHIRRLAEIDGDVFLLENASAAQHVVLEMLKNAKEKRTQDRLAYMAKLMDFYRKFSKFAQSRYEGEPGKYNGESQYRYLFAKEFYRFFNLRRQHDMLPEHWKNLKLSPPNRKNYEPAIRKNYIGRMWRSDREFVEALKAAKLKYEQLIKAGGEAVSFTHGRDKVYLPIPKEVIATFEERVALIDQALKRIEAGENISTIRAALQGEVIEEDFPDDLIRPRTSSYMLPRILFLPGYDASPKRLMEYLNHQARRYSQNRFGYEALKFYNNIIPQFAKMRIVGFDNKEHPEIKSLVDRYMLSQLYQITGRAAPEWVLGKWSDEAIAARLTKIQNKLASFFGLKQKEITPYDVARWSILEGQYQLLSKLAVARFVVANVFGGTVLTYQRSPGIKAVMDGYKAYINNEWPREFVKRFPFLGTEEMRPHEVVVHGGIAQEFYSSELRGKVMESTPHFRRLVAEFRKAMEMSPHDKKLGKVFESLKNASEEAGVNDAISWFGTMFIRKPEKMLRYGSFLTGYMQAMKMGFSHEEALAFARRFVERSQFFYDAPYRMPIANSALGRIFFRFRLWTLQNLRTQKEYLQDAARIGFKKGTAPFERFERAFLSNLFMVAMASAFPYTVFDAALPAPFSWVQDLSLMFFGNDEDRKRAFWGTYGLSEITPPILGLPLDVMMSFVNHDFDKIMNYTIWTVFPFGRLARDISKSIGQPHMLMDRMTGLPFHRMSWYRKDVIGAYWPSL